jgi:hypothetical protein
MCTKLTHEVDSVCLSVCPCVSNQSTLDRFWLNMVWTLCHWRPSPNSYFSVATEWRTHELARWEEHLLGWTESFCVFQMKSQSFFSNIFTIFNQLYNFHCLLLPSPNVSQAFQFRPCKNFLVCLRHLFENAKTSRSTHMYQKKISVFKETKRTHSSGPSYTIVPRLVTQPSTSASLSVG